MIREHVLKVVLVLVGLLFLAGLYPLLTMHPDPAEAMLAVVYATLGFFLVLAARNTSANRSLVAFTAWSSFAHGDTNRRVKINVNAGTVTGLSYDSNGNEEISNAGATGSSPWRACTKTLAPAVTRAYLSGICDFRAIQVSFKNHVPTFIQSPMVYLGCGRPAAARNDGVCS
jgi:hypothetical protein